MLVKDMYDKLALNTGFPIYTNDTDAPDINRFLLAMLNEGLYQAISNIYLCNNVLERKDALVTIKGKAEYGINGIIKHITMYDKNGKKLKDLPYLYNKNPYDESDKQETPRGYVIRGGYLKLIDTPDDEYTLKMIISTTDLVFADDNTARSTIEHINDTVCASDEFCNIVICAASALVFARCQNANTTIYTQLADTKTKLFIEQDNASMEGIRGYNRNGGHYDNETGLLGGFDW